MLFKKRVTIDEMSKALYAYTIDENPIDELSRLADVKNIKQIIKKEVTLLKIFTINNVLCSKKFQEKYGEKANKLFVCFFKHFINQMDKNGTSNSFIDLLEERAKIYNEFVEKNSGSKLKTFPFKIAEQLQDYCGLEYDAIFISWVLKNQGEGVQLLTNMFDKFKLVD